jgi:hypothetical protein
MHNEYVRKPDLKIFQFRNLPHNFFRDQMEAAPFCRESNFFLDPLHNIPASELKVT